MIFYHDKKIKTTISFLTVSWKAINYFKSTLYHTFSFSSASDACLAMILPNLVMRGNRTEVIWLMDLKYCSGSISGRFSSEKSKTFCFFKSSCSASYLEMNRMLVIIQLGTVHVKHWDLFIRHDSCSSCLSCVKIRKDYWYFCDKCTPNPFPRDYELYY